MNAINRLIQFATENQFFSGGMILGIIGGLLVYLRKIPHEIIKLIKRHIIIELEITNYDNCFKWFVTWFNKHKYVEKSNVLMLSSRTKSDNGDEYDETEERNFLISPGVGIHKFWYKKSFFWINRNRENEASGDKWSPKKFEYFEIYTFRWNKNKLLELIKETQTDFYKKDWGSTIGLHTVCYGEWSSRKRINKRPTESVVLQNNNIDLLINDIKNFKGESTENYYIEKGIPYKRTYLFHGHPGTGKTSCIKALASEFNTDIYIVNLSNAKTDDDKLLDLFDDIPKFSFIVMEDIDTANSTKRKTNTKLTGTTFSGLLNIMDGINSEDGRIIFATTNKIESIDPAFLRPGRIDKIMQFDYANEYQIGAMFDRFFISNNGEKNQFINTLKPHKELTTATIQELLINSTDIQSAIKNAQTLVK